MEVVLGKDGIKKEIGIEGKKEKGHTIKMAKDLGIKNMNTIVKIEPTKVLYRENFDKVKNLNNDFFDYVVEQYPSKILDMFEDSLKEDSEEIKLLDSQYFKLINEEKYLNFIVEVFEKNNSTCYVEIATFKNYDNDFLLKILNELDIVDKYILLKQIDIISSTLETRYIIKDKFLLKMLFKCMLRELIPIEFYFLEKPLIIFNNFDMSIPLVFKNKEDIPFYKQIAEKSSLFFR
jgi:hypothetical protein